MGNGRNTMEFKKVGRGMKEIIVYYSNRGNSRLFSKLLEEKENIPAIELKEVRKRKGVIGFLLSGYQAMSNKESKLIGEPWEEIKEYESIYLICPVWAANPVPAINAFLNQADLTGKKVDLVTVQADPKFDGSEEVFKKLKSKIEEKGGELSSHYKVKGEGPFDDVSETKMKEALNGFSVRKGK